MVSVIGWGTRTIRRFDWSEVDDSVVRRRLRIAYKLLDDDEAARGVSRLSRGRALVRARQVMGSPPALGLSKDRDFMDEVIDAWLAKQPAATVRAVTLLYSRPRTTDRSRRRRDGSATFGTAS